MTLLHSGQKLIRTSLLFGVILYLIFGVVALAQAQFSDEIDIMFTPSQEELTVGDPVALTLSVKHPMGYEVVVPQLPLVWGDYDVLEQGDVTTVSDQDGYETSSQSIRVTLFDLGTFQTPSLNIILRNPDGELIERVVPQLSLTVTPVLAADDDQLRDIKPQAVVEAPIPWRTIGGIAALLLLLGVIGWWLYRRLAKARPEQVEQVPAPYFDPRPAYQIAYDELDRIERLDLPGQGRFKEHYSLVTDCLRHYLGGMYHIPAIDLTTSETKMALQKSPLASAQGEHFMRLFTEGDLVKFARFLPAVDEAYQLVKRARTLVDETKIIARVEPTRLNGSESETEREAPTVEAV